MILDRYTYNDETSEWEDLGDRGEIGGGIEVDLFEPIINAFLEMYPDQRYGRFHHILDDLNLEYGWISDALTEAAKDRLYDYDYIAMRDDPAFVLLYGLKAVYDALGLRGD